MVKEYRSLILNVFLSLLVITLFFYFYKRANPFVFLGLVERLSAITVLFGLLTVILYLPELEDFKIPKNLLKPGFELKLPEFKFKFKSGFEFEKLSFSELKKVGFEYLKKLREKKLEFGFPSNLVKDTVNIIKENKITVLKWGFGLLLYGYFLNWVYPKVSIDEFMFFVLLFYIPLSLRLKLDSRYPIASALFLLVVCAITLAQGYEENANRIAIYAYYGLVIGVSLQFVEYTQEH